ncbi:MAG: zf-HC2 domain-containing protein [Betaproteobacteria bacterium]|nr:zf-HC2 domain-containing protein [Betaproteobacteria bacterium]
MLSCKEATRLMSQKMDSKLPALERLSLTFHLLICHGCRSFGSQLRFMRKAVRCIADGSETPGQDAVVGDQKPVIPPPP